jgi:beta-glucanase (GH16 family)
MKFNFSLFLLFLNQICLCQYHNTCISENVLPIYDKVCNSKPLTLFFEDNFDGNQVDYTKWNIREKVIRDFDFGHEKQWLSLDNIVLDNGSLRILTTKNIPPLIGTYVDYSTTPYANKTASFDYSSGEIWSQQTFGHGQYEIRAKLPQGVGFWPAFWTFGGIGWNEIDVFEIYTENPYDYNMNIHYFPGSQAQGSRDCHEVWDDGPNFSSAYHTFTMFWDYFKIAWYVDGNLVRVVYKYHNILGQPIDCNTFQPYTTYILNKAFPVENMHIVLNTSVVSPLNQDYNTPNTSTPFPGVFEIDYIKYLEKTPEPASCNNDVLKWAPFTGTSIGDEGLLFGNATVNSGTSATVIVRNYLTIKPNFSAKQGSFFAAKVNPYVCGSSARIEDDTLVVVEDDNLQRLIHNADTTYVGAESLGEVVYDVQISVYPNPTEGIIKIDNLNKQIGSRLEIFNMMGSKVVSLKIIEDKLLYDFSSQPKGLYLIKISGGANDYVTKVIYN